MKCKVRPFILGHLLFTFYNCVCVFSIQLFSNISQTVLGSSRKRFCRKFQVLSLGNKNDFKHGNKREEILKVLRGQLFLEQALDIYIYIYIYILINFFGVLFRCVAICCHYFSN